MSVRIRLRRTGTRNWSCFRIVVADKRSARNGNSIEMVGFYDPLHKEEKIDMERVQYWLSQGASPSETVVDIIARAKSGKKLCDVNRRQRPSKKARAKVEAEAKKAAEAVEAEVAAKKAVEAAAAPADAAPAQA